jgi:hypothetical protein
MDVKRKLLKEQVFSDETEIVLRILLKFNLSRLLWKA